MSWSAASSRGKLFSDHGIQQNLCSSAVKTNADSRQDLFTGSPQPQVGCSHPSFLLSFFASPTNKPKLLNPSLQSHCPGCSAICLLVMGSQGEGERTVRMQYACPPPQHCSDGSQRPGPVMCHSGRFFIWISSSPPPALLHSLLNVRFARGAEKRLKGLREG